MFKRKNANRQLETRLKDALETGTPIEELDSDLVYYLQDRLTGSFIILALVAVILALFHFTDQTAAFRTLLFATVWKAIDAWSRPYFQPFINYQILRKK